MNDTPTTKIHWSFWLIAGVALVWNVLGSINFVVQLNPDMVDTYREAERAIIVNRPAWATVAFAVAVFGGVVGCVLLLLRKSIAFYLFIASLIGVIVTIVHSLSVVNNLCVGEILGIVLMPVAVAAFLIWYSKMAEKEAWIG